MVINITTNSTFLSEFNELARFFSEVTLSPEGEAVNIRVDGENITISYRDKSEVRSVDISNADELTKKSELKRLAKIMLYDALCQMTGQVLPYGSLTGIRPTKLYHDLCSKGINAHEYFTDYLRVSESATTLIEEIVDNQKGIYSFNDDEIDLFVNIPICASRCSYCSFISAEYSKITKWIEPYVSLLIREIESARQLILAQGYKLRSIYVGGGTPTSLNETEFAAVMSALKGLDCIEFTVEAGRPDTITADKLRVMSECGVSRISINPQTFNEQTLKLIGRNHSVEDIYRIYAEARKYDFDINTDLIAMLPEESFEDFKLSVDAAIALSPENITVHTLALKRGSSLKESNYDNKSVQMPTQMIEYSRKAMKIAGYSPYYMYKQKYMSGNLDNTGYAKEGKACIYNIDIMEETRSILACGAGGISKRVYSGENRLERLANPKGIDVYLERADTIITDKAAFFNRG